MARPLKEINWDIVEKRMEAGNKGKSIAEAFHVDLDTFYRRFKQHYGFRFGDYAVHFYECGDDNLAYTQYMKALSGNTTMLTWLGKVRLGQREPDMLSATPANQQEIDKDQIIMQLQHKLLELEENANKSKAE